jgi:hypothetical protein
MPFRIRPYRRSPVQYAVTYALDYSKARGPCGNLSYTGWRLSGDLPIPPGKTLSLTVTLPNERCIEVPQAVVR